MKKLLSSGLLLLLSLTLFARKERQVQPKVIQPSVEFSTVWLAPTRVNYGGANNDPKVVGYENALGMGIMAGFQVYKSRFIHSLHLGWQSDAVNFHVNHPTEDVHFRYQGRSHSPALKYMIGARLGPKPLAQFWDIRLGLMLGYQFNGYRMARQEYWDSYPNPDDPSETLQSPIAFISFHQQSSSETEMPVRLLLLMGSNYQTQPLFGKSCLRLGFDVGFQALGPTTNAYVALFEGNGSRTEIYNNRLSPLYFRLGFNLGITF